MRVKSLLTVGLAVVLTTGFVACASSATGGQKEKKIKEEVSVKIDANQSDTVQIIIKENGKTREYRIPKDEFVGPEGFEKYLNHSLDSDIWHDFHFKGGEFGWNHAFLGVSVQKLGDQLRKFFKTDGNAGVLVAEVVEDSPASESGIQAGDVITQVDDAIIQSPEDLTAAIGEYEPGTEVKIHLFRNGQTKVLAVELAANKSRPMQAYNMRKFERIDPGSPRFWFQPDSDFQKQLDDMRSTIEELQRQLKTLQQK